MARRFGVESRQQGIGLWEKTAGSERHQYVVHVEGLYRVGRGTLRQNDPARRNPGMLKCHAALAVPLHAILLKAQLAEFVVKLAVGQGFVLWHLKFASAGECASLRRAAALIVASTETSPRPICGAGERASARSCD